MRFSPFLSEMIRGEWLLDVNSIEGYYPIIQALLSEPNFKFESKYDIAPKVLDILDDNGNPLRAKNGEVIQIPERSIAQVSMIGEVVRYGDWCAVGIDEIVSELRTADSMQNVEATIFRIDGPGGTVKAIGPLLDFARTKTKPIVGLADDALSLHYWALAGVCDYIIADNDVSARFGSVGVVSSFRDNQEALEKLGIKFHEIYPEESKHKNEAFTLARAGKYDMIRTKHLAPLAIKFQDSIRANRPNLKEEVGVLTGDTFYADKALGLGMIDAIGGMDLAIEIAHRLADQQKIKSLLN